MCRFSAVGMLRIEHVGLRIECASELVQVIRDPSLALYDMHYALYTLQC